MPFDLAFAAGDLGECGGPPLRQVVDPLARLGDRGQERLAPRRLNRRVVSRDVDVPLAAAGTGPLQGMVMVVPCKSAP